MDFDSITVKYSEIKQDAHLAELYSKIYTIPKMERVKVLMSWLANAYSDLLIPFLPESEVLATFTVNVRLLDTFSNNSSYEIVAQLAAEFSDNFLALQVIPNLLENHEKTSDVTYYIQIICENVTCPSLIRKIMDVVTSKLTPILIARMTSENHSVVSSTLSLIKTLLEYYCEDFWYDLILQYLLPMKHLITFQRQKLLPEIEFHESTHKLLELIPRHVTQTTNPSLLADHFLLYYQDEIMRLRIIDTAVASSVPSSKTDLQRVGLGISDEEMLVGSRQPGKNQTYPMWIFRYDGTDFLHALRKGLFYEEPEEFFEDDLFSASNQLDQSTVESAIVMGEDDEGNESGEDIVERVLSQCSNTLSEGKESDSLYDIPSGNPATILKVPDHLVENLQEPIVKNKRKSFDTLEDVRTNSAYFGPFLHTLFEILQKWAALEPDVLFTATEVVSVLASSRIPLINTIFLDMSLTLQPSYPSFSTLIHSVKNELEEHMDRYPDYIFRNVWKAAAKDCSLADFCTKHGPVTDDDDTSQSGFVGKLRRTISASKSLRMAAEEVQKTMGISRRGSTFRAFTDIFKNSQTSDRLSEYRLLNRATSPFQSEEEENSAKVMALRSILFTHWMLELGAIAMQLSWGRRPLHTHENTNCNDDDETAKEANNDDDDSPTSNLHYA